MKKLWLLFLVVIPYQAVHAQEVKHAPTVAQCQADQKLWLSKLEQQQPLGSGIANVSYYELSTWTSEMGDCLNVDPQFDWQYYNTIGEVRFHQLARVGKFLHRHNLLDQLLADDAQGKVR